MTRIRDRGPAGLVPPYFVRNVRTCKNATNPVGGQARMAAVNRIWGAAAGLPAGAVALGVAELTAAALPITGGPLGAPVVAVGEAAINLTPVRVKEFAIAHFETHDEQALIAGILALLAAFAAVTGVLAVRHGAGNTRPDTVRHAERELLPRGHRPGTAAALAAGPDAADRRDGRAGTRDRLRPAAPDAADRGRDHAGLRLERGRQHVQRQRPLVPIPCPAGPAAGIPS
jgi:hypothetical protein